MVGYGTRFKPLKFSALFVMTADGTSVARNPIYLADDPQRKPVESLGRNFPVTEITFMERGEMMTRMNVLTAGH